MFPWQLVLLLSSLAMLATCLPMVQEVTTQPSHTWSFNGWLVTETTPLQTESIDRGIAVLLSKTQLHLCFVV